MDGQGAAAAAPQGNVIRLDPIAMLTWMLSAIFHDPIHDFGLSIERMAKIVLYIDNLVQELGALQPMVGGGDSLHLDEMIGGVRSRSHMLMSRMGSHKEKRTPSQGSKSKSKSKSRRSKSPDGVKKTQYSPPKNLHTIFEKEHLHSRVQHNTSNKSAQRKQQRYKKQVEPGDVIVDNLPLPVRNQEEPYLYRYSNISQNAIINNIFRANNIALELLIKVNNLIDSLKLQVIQHVLMTNQFTKDEILDCISDIISQMNATTQNPESEFTVDHFNRTKIIGIFILENMWRLLNYIRVRDDNPGQMNMDNSFTTYKNEQRRFLYLNLFNGQIFDDIMRVIVLGKISGIQQDPDISEIYRLFAEQRLREQQGGGDNNCSTRKMTGGAKMNLSSFRDSLEVRRNELVDTLNEWKQMKEQGLPADAPQYSDFYRRISTPPTGTNRQTDPRLIRTIDSEKFGEMKKDVERVQQAQQTRAIAALGQQPGRMTRHRQAELIDTTTIKDVIDSFMERVKSDFDSLIAEEELAREAAEAADAAAPIRGSQREVVYKFSYLIAKKGLEYAVNELNLIQGDMTLGVEAQRLLPNIDAFLPIAILYVQDILGQGPIAEMTLAADFAGDYVEKDKYNTLLFQLYLLGIIYRHDGRNGGLPDIDSRLAANVVAKFETEEHATAYRVFGYEYLNNEKSQELFRAISRDSNNWLAINNSVPVTTKGQIQNSTVCTIPARVDAAGTFGGCTETNHQFQSMNMTVTDTEGRTGYFTKHNYVREANKVTIVYRFNLGNDVVSKTIEDIDLSKAPHVLSANSVFKDAINTVLAIWKNNPQQGQAQALWDLLEQPENFKRLMSIISMKGKGDIDQENSVFVPRAGYDDDISQQHFVTRWQTLTNKIIFAGGDRPSSARAMIIPKFAANRAELLKGGQVVVSYANDTKSFTLAHRSCIPQIMQGQLNPRGQQSRAQQSRAQQAQAQARAPLRGQPSAEEERSRGRSREPYGGNKTRRRLHKVNSRYTQKKYRSRK